MEQNSKELCNSILWNLLELHRKDDQVANGFLRELFNTQECDDFYNLSSEREKYKDYLGNESLSRILNFEETEKDKKISAQAILHNYSSTSKKLEQSLSIKNRFIYYITNKAQGTLATIGIISSMYAFFNIIKKIKQ